MIVYELTGTEENDEYKRLEYFNTDRQLHFLESLVHLAVNFNRTFLSQTLIKALNFHAIACLLLLCLMCQIRRMVEREVDIAPVTKAGKG